MRIQIELPCEQTNETKQEQVPDPQNPGQMKTVTVTTTAWKRCSDTRCPMR